MSKPSINEIRDESFHHLTPRSFVKSRGHRYWRCECVCGNFVTRREDSILRGTTKSCGCQHPRRKKGASHPTWKGCGQLNGQYYGHLKNMAEKRGYSFDVSIEYLWKLFVEQDGKCALTGEPLCFQTHKDKLAGLKQTASLDRRDSTLGYIEGNVWWVHKDVNEMKKAFPLDRFLEVCRLVYKHSTAKLAA